MKIEDMARFISIVDSQGNILDVAKKNGMSYAGVRKLLHTLETLSKTELLKREFNIDTKKTYLTTRPTKTGINAYRNFKKIIELYESFKQPSEKRMRKYARKWRSNMVVH